MRPRPLPLEGARARPGTVVYRVIASDNGEMRRVARSRARLRSAKILDGASAFVCEALIQDMSPRGMRLLLARNIGLPARFAVHDDATREIVTVVAVWRRERALGVRVLASGPIAPLKRADRAALAGRYYAVPD